MSGYSFCKKCKAIVPLSRGSNSLCKKCSEELAKQDLFESLFGSLRANPVKGAK